MDEALLQVFDRFISLKGEDVKKSREIFNRVFEQVKQKMNEQCNYFKKYSSQVMHAGSVYDGVKVSQLDEFDIDIVIRLPICYGEGEDGIVLECDQPGHVRLRITRPFDNLRKQRDWRTCTKVTRNWRDGDKYLLQNKFRDWIHSIVQRTLNAMGGLVVVNGVAYRLKYRESGPSFKLCIRNEPTDEEFSLDVDLVPVIRFLVPRWPAGFRKVSDSQLKEWLVVPVANRATIEDERLFTRHWQLSFHEFEHEKIKGHKRLKTAMRLVKKLRDAQEMTSITSYCIKTLFLWKLHEASKEYWESSMTVIFLDMVRELYNAIVGNKIPYFWDDRYNLIAGLVKPANRQVYAEKLRFVVNSIRDNDVDAVVSSLLTAKELREYKDTKVDHIPTFSYSTSKRQIRHGCNNAL